METLFEQAKKIRLFIFDVDGVLTNGLIYHTSNGDELKAFYVHDGLGIKLLQRYGVHTAIITSRTSPLLLKRAKELSIEYIYQGQSNKTAAFEELSKIFSAKDDEIAYMGDDLPDLGLMKRVGLSIAPANAHPVIKEHASWTTTLSGGQGAVREICDIVLKAQGHWSDMLESYLTC
jgi:3-deoxy-D-manno-octulosonate 8-phosphate phosphatase (KDO 8-P phosphatase)